ncbi:hypothetical protein LCGC14_0629300 [marine sediment metagenome]|uniref:Uncharacterized protein n=1 Tax=marine sediment metagenome TaxID=412755 RepID=A0A0F9R2F4_9ZZZZ
MKVTKEETWTMGELEDYQLEELARQIGEGYTSGRLDDENANIYWELKYNVWKD